MKEYLIKLTGLALKIQNNKLKTMKYVGKN